MTEPLLSPNLFEIIKTLKGRGHSVRLTTNGFLLPKKVSGLIDSGLDSIQVSIDGPPDIHNKIRGGKGFFENAIEGIKLLNENSSDMFLSINYTVSNLNFGYLKKFSDIINEKVKIDLLKFQFMDFVSKKMVKKQNELYTIKQTESSLSNIVDPEKVDIEELRRQIYSVKRTNYKNIKKISVIPNISTERELGTYFNKDGLILKKYSSCLYPFRQIALNVNGDVLIHVRCFNYKLGNIFKENIKQIFWGRRAKYFRNELKKANYCFPACSRCCGVMFDDSKK